MALAEDVVPDDDGAADPDGDPETEDDPDGDGSAGAVVLGSVVGELLGPPLGSAAELEALGHGEGDGDGDGDGEGEGEGEGVGEGDGDGVGEDASSWHLVSVLAEAVVLTSLTESARAVPVQGASMLRIRKPPASKLSVIARTCAKRI